MSSTPITVMATTGLTKEAAAKIIQRHQAIDAIADEIQPESLDLLFAADADPVEPADDAASPADVILREHAVSTSERLFWTLFFNQGSLSNLGIKGLLFNAEDDDQTMIFNLVSEESAKKLKSLLSHKYGVKAEDILVEEEEENIWRLALTSEAIDKLFTKAAVMPGIRDQNILDSIAFVYTDVACKRMRKIPPADDADAVAEYREKIDELTAGYLDELVKNPFFAHLERKIDERLMVEGSTNTSASPMAAAHLSNEGAQEAARKLLAPRVGLRSLAKRKLDDIGFKLADEDADYDYQFTIKHGEKTDTFSVNGYAYTVEEEDSPRLGISGYGFDQAQVRFEGALTQENARNLVILSVMRLLTCQEVKEGWKQHAYKYTLTCDSKNKEFVKQFINEAIKVGANVQLVGAARHKFAESKQVNKLLLKAKKQHEKCMASNDGYGAPPARTYKGIMLSLLRTIVYYMTFKRFCKPEDDLDFIAEEASSAVKVDAFADPRTDEKDAGDDYRSQVSDENEHDRDAELGDDDLVDIDDAAAPAAATDEATPAAPEEVDASDAAPPAATAEDGPENIVGGTQSAGLLTRLWSALPSLRMPASAQDDDYNDDEDKYDFRGAM